MENFGIITEGKFKKIYASSKIGMFNMVFKYDNVKDNFIKAKISQFLFTLLKNLNINNHFLESIGSNIHLVEALDIIPLKFKVFLYSNKEMFETFGLEEGIKLNKPFYNIYFKNKNQLATKDQLINFNCLNEEDLNYIENTILRISDCLFAFFYAFNLKISDFQLEFGKKYINQGNNYEIYLADELNLSTINLIEEIEKLSDLDLAKIMKII